MTHADLLSYHQFRCRYHSVGRSGTRLRPKQVGIIHLEAAQEKQKPWKIQSF